MYSKEYVNQLFRGKDLETFLPLPSLAIVGDLEEAQRLKDSYDRNQLIVVHMPDWLDSNDYETLKVGGRRARKAFRLDGQKYHGLLVPGKQLATGTAYVYQTESNQPDSTSSEELEENLRQEICRRQEEGELLREMASKLLIKDSTAEIKSLVYDILHFQYSEPEVFIREAIQNSAAAAPDSQRNRIDVYIDSQERIVRIEDDGCGMTPEILEDVFFNLYRSINETDLHAAGKFGIGACSFFGMDHDQVVVDSLHTTGRGARVSVDKELMRGPLEENRRRQPGTTIEIRFSDRSNIQLKRIAEILKRDCQYVRTPIYLHCDETVERINESLGIAGPGRRHFKTDIAEGFLERSSKGRLDLLSHRIRLTSLSVSNFRGVVNCDYLDTTLSRDSARNDPALQYVWGLVNEQAALLLDSAVNFSEVSAEARLARYRSYVHEKLLGDEGPKEEWLRRNLRFITQAEYENWEAQEKADSGVLPSIVYASASAIVEKLVSPLGRKVKVLLERSEGNPRVPQFAKTWNWWALFCGTATALLAAGLLYCYYLWVFMSDSLLENSLVILFYAIVGEWFLRRSWVVAKQKVRLSLLRRHSADMLLNYDPVLGDRPWYLRVAMILVGFVTLVIGLVLCLAGLEYLVQEVTTPTVSSSPNEFKRGGDGGPYTGFLMALGAIAIYLMLRLVQSRWRLTILQEELEETERAFLADVKREMEPFGDFDVHYGANLNRSDPLAIFSGSRIILNKMSVSPAWAVALMYTSEVSLDLTLSRSIFQNKMSDQ